MSDDRIPGTRVPDTPIHRASLWLEAIKFAERAGEQHEPAALGDTVELIAREIPEGGTPEQIVEAAEYYGRNLAAMLMPSTRVQIAIPDPTGDGLVDIRAVFMSAWLDGYMHGVATATGKRGESTQERRRR